MSHLFWANLFRRGGSDLQTIARMWQQTPLFEGIPPRHIEQLCGNMHRRQFKPGETIFHLGDQGAGAILVLRGAVRIMTHDTELARFRGGDFFGEIALATTEMRTADAVAIDACELIYFLRQDLEEWIEHEPRLGARFLMNLSAVLAHRLYEINAQLGNP